MPERKITIAVVAPQEPFEYFDAFWDGVWSAAHELAPLGVQVCNATSDRLVVAEQECALQRLLGEHPHAIVLFPSHVTRLNGLIEQHSLRGTPVITAGIDVAPSRRIACVAPDFGLAGKLAGELLSKMLPPKSHIVAITGEPDKPHLQQRYEGFRQALRASRVAFAISEFAEPDVFAHAIAGRSRKFDGLYLGCGESIDSGKILAELRPPARSVAFELTEAVKWHLTAGTVCAVVDSSRYYQGYIAVQKAYECLQPHSDQRSVTIPSNIVMASHAANAGFEVSANSIFEAMVRQRTLQLQSYKQALEVSNSRLMGVAETDPLTNALNRRRLGELAEELVANTRDSSSGAAMLVVDIDEFRSLNDHLGRSEGDEALRLVADAIRAECAEAPLARFGGDQFAVILSEADPAASIALRDRIVAAIEGVRLTGAPDLSLAATVGRAGLPARFRSGADLIAAAEENLDAIKRSRNWTRLRRLHLAS